jgi:prophage regulatory protein
VSKSVRRRVLRLPQVIEKTGCSKSKIYADMRRGLFPLQAALGPQSVGWHEQEIDRYLNALPRVERDENGRVIIKK